MSLQIADIEYIESKVNILEWINYDPKVGVDGIQYTGLPGSGKTSMANRTVKDCIKIKNENWLIPGDRFCEWRHFLMYPRIIKKITLFIPEDQKIFYYGMPLTNKGLPNDQEIINRFGVNGFDFETKVIDYRNFDINHYFNNTTEKEIFIVFDNHYQGQYLWKRAELWKNINKQLLERTKLVNTAFGLLFNEAGILWQQGAQGQHWHEVNRFAELLVEDRKGLVRNVHLTQLETEEEHDIRKKLLWKCYRFGTTSKFAPEQVRKAVPFQARSNFVLMCGGLFTIGNTVKKFTEMDEVWKMIPIGDPVDVLQELQEQEKQKQLDRKQKEIEKHELLLQRQEERKQNRIYFLEQEMIFKKELMKQEYENKMNLLKINNKQKEIKENAQKKKENDLIEKGIKFIQNNKALKDNISAFATALNISSHYKAKNILNQCQKRLTESKKN